MNTSNKYLINVQRQKIALDILDAMDRTSQSIFYIIQDGRFVYGNLNGCRITGLDPLKDVVGKFALTYVHPEDKNLLIEMTRKVMNGEEIEPFEWRLLTVDGNVVWVMGTLIKIEFNGRPAVFGNYIDITQTKKIGKELKNTSKKLEDMAIKIWSVREEERAGIAWEIHENLNHSLAGLKAELSDLMDNKTPAKNKDLLFHRINSAFDTITRVTTHLTPKKIVSHNLATAIRQYADEFEDKTGVVIDLNIPKSNMDFDNKETLTIFQLFKEILIALKDLGNFKKISIEFKKEGSLFELKFTCRIERLRYNADINSNSSQLRPLFAKIKEWNGSLKTEIKKQDLHLFAKFPIIHGNGYEEKRILLCCGQPILMEGIKNIISGKPEFFISDVAKNFSELLEKISEPDFHLIILDTLLLGGDETEKLKRIKDTAPLMPVLIFHTTGEDDDFAVRMYRQGAYGYISRSSSMDEMTAAIHKVAKGRKHINSRIAEKLAFEVDLYSEKPFHHKLSDRERQVMFMIAEGKKMKDIAEELCLNYKTIATYRSRVMEKMKMNTDAEIVRYVVSKGLI